MRKLLLIGIFSVSVYLGFKSGWAEAGYALIFFGVTFWLIFVIADMANSIGNWLNRPRITIYTESKDPTAEEDEHPLIVIDKFTRRK